MSERALAQQIDDLVIEGGCLIAESEMAAVVSSLSYDNAIILGDLTARCGLSFSISDTGGQTWTPETLDRNIEPYQISIEKPAMGNSFVILTSAGLYQFIDAGKVNFSWRVASLDHSFETWGSRFSSWHDAKDFTPRHPSKSPRDLVRESSATRQVAISLDHWILTSSQNLATIPRDWLARSAVVLMRSLCDEILIDGTLLLRGPPRVRLDAPKLDSIDVLETFGFQNLQKAAEWVFEDSAPTETRHGLYTDSLARSSASRTDPGAVFRASAQDALASARVAYQLGLTGLGPEAIKAMGDLRKAVADDTGKLADITRQVITNVTGASALQIGLIAAKIASKSDATLVKILSGSGAIYVFSIILSGYLLLLSQDRLRKAWRAKIYQFVPDSDYKALVSEPSREAEKAFWVSALGGLLVTGILFLIAMIA